MPPMRIHRRALLAGGPPAVTIALGWGAPAKADQHEAILKAGALAPPDQPIPSEPGALSAEELGRLWAINGEIVRRWRMADLPKDVFGQFLDQKTTSPPSYLGEYRHALALMGPLTDPRAVGAFLERVAAEGPDGSPDSAGLRRVKTYVVGEFMASNLMSGGFRQFGLRKIQGFMSGPRGYTPFAATT
jgi:hypothetical protein